MRLAKIRLSYTHNPLTFAATDFGGDPAPLTLPLDDGIETSKYVLKSVDGLDPTDNDIIMMKTRSSGSFFQKRSSQNREIIMNVGFRPDYSVGENTGDLREKLYLWYSAKMNQPVLITLLDSSNVVIGETLGWGKRFEGNPFSKDPEVSITFVCDRANFQKRVTALPVGNQINPYMPIDNPGTARSPFEWSCTFNSSISSFRLQIMPVSGIVTVMSQLYIFYNFINGDQLRYGSVPGSSYVYVVRSGVNISLLPNLVVTGGSPWLLLDPGRNHIYPSSFNFPLSGFTIYAQYAGV